MAAAVPAAGDICYQVLAVQVLLVELSLAGAAAETVMLVVSGVFHKTTAAATTTITATTTPS